MSPTDEWQAQQELVKRLRQERGTAEAAHLEALKRIEQLTQLQVKNGQYIKQLEGALHRMGRDFATAEGKDGQDFADSYLSEGEEG